MAKAPKGGDAASSTGEASASATFVSGSNTLPSMIDIGGVEVQLGMVVAAAFAASGLSAPDWDALEDAKRDELLNAQIEAMRADAAAAKADADAAAAAAQAQADAAKAAADAEAARLEKERVDAEAARLEQERAAAAASAAAAAGGQLAAEAQDLFPRTVTIRNNSGIAMSEPYSGAYLQAGGSATVTLHDSDHAHRVLENFAALLERNYLQPEVLSIEGLPA